MNHNQRRLVEVLSEILSSAEFESLFEQAVEQNSWFTRANILNAVRAIREQMLDIGKVEEWLSGYPFFDEYDVKQEGGQKFPCVGVVMAGNIPLVGFFDLFCVLISGYKAVVKPSSKDNVLISYIIEKLFQNGFPCSISKEITHEIDMLITMGGEDAAMFYSQEFTGIPTLIRSDRYSVAVLTGEESSEQLQRLNSDMFSYWGLGCRNVRHLYLPANYDLERLPYFSTDFKGFTDNYTHNRAMLTMLSKRFTDKGGYLLVPENHTSSIAVVSYSFYDTISEIKIDKAKIQCIVSIDNEHFPESVDFGMSQQPTLWDYPDSKDILKFLHNSDYYSNFV